MFPDLSFEEPPPPPPSRPSAPPKGIAAWVAHIREQDMPAFGVTVAAVQSLTEDEKASAGRLAQAILQDAAMTAKVLRLANSVYYNPGRQTISTISRAIVVLGFDIVAGIAIAASLVDALLRGGVRKRVVAEMARSFHAAVQARAVAERRRDGRSEEVFIAALLLRVGAMAFWCFGGEQAEALDKALDESALPPEEIQQKVLGFKLSQLSGALAREWKLGSLLIGVLENPARPSPGEHAVILAHALAREVTEGWRSPGARKVIEAVAEFSGLPVEEVLPELTATAGAAARMAAAYGAGEAAGLIPLSDGARAPDEDEAPIESAGDPMLQLRILRELSTLIATGGSVNDVLNLTLEGVFRGIGFERVLFALLAPNRTQLVGKAALGRGAESLRQRFVFSLEGEPGEVIQEVMTQGRSVRLPGQPPRARAQSERLRAVTGAEHAALAPIVAQGRPIGMFYADQSAATGPIDDERFGAFLHFVQHVSMALANLGSVRKSS